MASIASNCVTKVLKKSKARIRFKNCLEIKPWATLLEILFFVKKKKLLIMA